MPHAAQKFVGCLFFQQSRASPRWASGDHDVFFIRGHDGGGGRDALVPLAFSLSQSLAHTFLLSQASASLTGDCHGSATSLGPQKSAVSLGVPELSSQKLL
ncbi:hypothetical protein TorRG33x02_061730 [Trema orientale]|uniref:Uncharacterized protein n=1 Tax=Trema orientale TaxID=63057 RepID=A0A2P5FJY9_TREOI|nr:hypothetical protein TorRG33x02_061730 [Trema orientale]